jgi:hypothetical protein
MCPLCLSATACAWIVGGGFSVAGLGVGLIRKRRNGEGSNDDPSDHHA